MNAAVDWALVAARFATYGLAILGFGATVFRAAEPNAPDRPGWRRAGSALLALAAVAYLVLLARQAEDRQGLPSASALIEIVVGTGFGRALAATAVLALAGGFVRARRPALAVTGAALASLAFVGHAADGEGARGALRLGVMAAHLLAVGAWLGALPPLLGAVTRDHASAHATLRRFGRTAFLAVFVVLGAGLCSLAFIVADARGALGRAYLGALGVKLGFVAALLGVAAVNRWALTPLASRDPARAAAMLRVSVALEQLLGLGAIACAAWLGQLDPGM